MILSLVGEGELWLTGEGERWLTGEGERRASRITDRTGRRVKKKRSPKKIACLIAGRSRPKMRV